MWSLQFRIENCKTIFEKIFLDTLPSDDKAFSPPSPALPEFCFEERLTGMAATARSLNLGNDTVLFLPVMRKSLGIRAH